VPKPRPIAAGLGLSPAPQTTPVEPPHVTRTFEAYGVSRRLGSPGFWTDARDGLLFLFHVHGFSPLAEYAASSRSDEGDAFWADVVDSWLDTNEPPSTPAWHPYPTSLRIVAWSAALSSIYGWPADLREKLAASILRQARYLRRVVEHDVGGNHVIKNATALAVAGGLFPSSGLLEVALRRLERETAAQVLADGGHEERTTSYHRLVMADLSDVRDVLTRIDHPVAAWLDDVLARMTAWASIMAGPDGRLPLLNDSWEGPAISHGGPELSVLRESGYVVLRHGEDQLVFDCGPLCPRHLPAHAHADALSVVVWLDGVPVIIDRGSGSYTGTIRECSRSTRAHNTVEIGGEDQCVFFGDFRAARLPRVAEAGVEHHGEVTVVSSAHDGYRRLPVPAEHARSVVWWPQHGVVLLDRIFAAGRVSVRSALTLAPGAPRPEPVGSLTTELHRQSVLWPVFGREVQTDVVEIHGDVCGDVVFGWSLLRPGAEVLRCDRERVVLSRRDVQIEVPLTWRTGPLRA
jgi:uncharacterized heparinase superfamily protein